MNTTMNTVNQTFDWSRFTAALRKEVVENSRTILFTILSVYALLSIVMIFGNIITGMNDSSLEDISTMGNGIQPHYTVVGYILMFAVAIVASFSFKKLTKKTGRIDMFTSPTSTFEKFLVNVVIYVLGFIVVYFICAQLADLTRIAVLWYFHNDIIVPGPINFLPTLTQAYNFGPMNELMGMSEIFSLGILANAGLFLLGSVLWPRLSFLKTFAAMYAVEIVLGILFVAGAFIIGDDSAIAFTRWIANAVENGTFKIILIGLVIAQLILYWGLAWYLFKRKDVISLKWWK